MTEKRFAPGHDGEFFSFYPYTAALKGIKLIFRLAQVADPALERALLGADHAVSLGKFRGHGPPPPPRLPDPIIPHGVGNL